MFPLLHVEIGESVPSRSIENDKGTVRCWMRLDHAIGQQHEHAQKGKAKLPSFKSFDLSCKGDQG